MNDNQIATLTEGIKGMQLALAVRDHGIPIEASTGIARLISGQFTLDMPEGSEPCLKATSGLPLADAIREALARPEVAPLVPASARSTASAAPVLDDRATMSDHLIALHRKANDPAQAERPTYRQVGSCAIQVGGFGRNPNGAKLGLGAGSLWNTHEVTWNG